MASAQQESRRGNSKFKIKNFSVGDSKNAADEFWEIGHSADGGLRNGDLLTLKSAKATILPTASCDPENLSPRGFNPHSRLFLLAARHSVNKFTLCSRSAASVEF